MAIYDRDTNGTNREIGILYDRDISNTNHQTGKVYDRDTSNTNRLIYKSDFEIFNSGLKNGYSGKIIEGTTYRSSVSGSSITLTLTGGVASDCMCIFTPAINLSKYSKITLYLTANNGSWNGDTRIYVSIYSNYSGSIWENHAGNLVEAKGTWTGQKTFTFSRSGTKYLAVRKCYGSNATITKIILE